ncbi:MAG: hypothetical protein HYW26_05825 [Candidatus Aenigmarchaeota archaeon]|nr:hypothetical protein [Candidatus Aenigmarchaeota archaeon]
MKSYDKLQKHLVIETENVHKKGVRHTGLSGYVCEKLLMEDLRKEFRNVKFDRGIVTFSDKEGHTLRKDMLTNQIDIIGYRKHKFKKYDIVVVPNDKVLLCIEVKKWSYYSEKKLREIKNKLDKLKKRVHRPIFYVAFRYHGSYGKRIENLKRLRKFLSPHKVYAFSSATQRNKYPEEDKNFKTYYPPREIERFFADIRELVARQ